NGMSLMEISDCLRILAKYAKEMLKPTKERYKHWNKIPFMKAGAPQKWTRMDGTKTILKQLGYTQETSKGYIFPLHSFGPPLNVIKSLSLELALAAAELSVFYNNHHPHPEYIRNIMCPGGALLPSASSAERREFNVMDLLAEVGNSANLRDLTQAPIPAQNLMSPAPHKGRGRPPTVARVSEGFSSQRSHMGQDDCISFPNPRSARTGLLRHSGSFLRSRTTRDLTEMGATRSNTTESGKRWAQPIGVTT
ncbi:hypothetical protein HPB47_007218, partial [Ixodes persulcatus]